MLSSDKFIVVCYNLWTFSVTYFSMNFLFLLFISQILTVSLWDKINEE